MIRSPAGFDGGDRIKRYLDYYQPSYGVMMLSAGQFSPAQLFASGEIGAWYDPSDLTTMFQDSAGTTPVTAVGQAVGLILDKSQNGVGTNGGKRLNLLAWTEQFDNSYWIKSSVTISSNQAVAPDGTLTADLMYPLSNGTFRSVYNSNPLAGGRVLKIRAKAAGLSWLWFVNGPGNAVAAWFNLSTGVKGTAISGYTHDIQPLGDGWYECTMTSASADIIFAQFGVSDADNSSTVTSSGTNGVYLWGADMRTVANSTITPLYQPITADWVSTLAGNHALQSTSTARPTYQSSGGLSYLAFDGTDDFLVTGTINPGSVDKAQVFAGVRKLSDAASAVLVETSTDSGTNNGAMGIFAPSTVPATRGYRFRSTGTLSGTTDSAAFNAPITSVVTALGDISGDYAALRVNGAISGTPDTANQGTGNYLSYAMYVGRRAGTSAPFNGSLYSLIVRFSAANLSDSVISQTETWVNAKTLAY